METGTGSDQKMFKRLPIMALACVLFSNVVQATPVRIDFRSTIGFANWTDATWGSAGEIAGTILLNTDASSISTTTYPRNDGQTVVGQYKFAGFEMSGMSASFDGHGLYDFQLGDGSSHGYSAAAPGLYLYESWLGTTSAGPGGSYLFELPLFSVVSAAQFASFGDPMLNLLMATGSGGGTFSGSGDFGKFGGSLSYLSIREVPEPGTLGLLAIGLAGLAAFRLRREKRLG
jgi:hypothetical protein